MKRHMIFAYGVASYAIGMGSIVYMIGWLGNIVVPRSIDSAATVPFSQALMINAALFMAFCLQHSVMARPRFKCWLTKYVPESAERSTYVLFSGIALTAAMLGWQPMGIPVWDIQNTTGQTMAYTLYGMGWVILVGSTFALNHFDLFGLRQVWMQFRNKDYKHLPFAIPGPYNMVRHPLYVGWITLAWATPTMSVAHLAFALATTAYILIAIQLEERDLLEYHGEKYADYRRRTPMLIPSICQSLVGDSTENAQAMNKPIHREQSLSLSESSCMFLNRNIDDDETLVEFPAPQVS